MSPIDPSVTRRYDFPAHRVYLSPTWKDAEWILRKHLYCNWIQWAIGPGHDRAELQWYYGPVIHPKAAAAVVEQPLMGILDYYVKIVIDPAEPEDLGHTWYGVITEASDQQLGIISGQPPRGEQRILCHGLSILLDRSFVLSSYIDSASGQQKQIHRALGFNSENPWFRRGEDAADQSARRFGNRSVQKADEDVYVFAENLAEAELWTSRDIVQYLLAYHSPSNFDGDRPISWGLTQRALNTIPDWDCPVLAAEKQTLWRLCAQLFDRRRFMGYRIAVESTGDSGALEPRLDVFSFSEDMISLPDGGFIGPNGRASAVDLDPYVDVAELAVKSSAAHCVERVICRGGRKRAVGTFSFADGTLEADWTSGDQTLYEQGSTEIAGLTDEAEKSARLKLWRTEDKMRRVFSHFRVPLSWNGSVGDGIGGPKDRLFPDDSGYGQEEIYRGLARFDRALPAAILLDSPDQSPQDRLEAAAWIKVWSHAGADRYQHLEKLGADRMAHVFLSEHPGGDISCNLQVQQQGLGIIVRVHGGRMHGQEAIAKTDFHPTALFIDAIEPPYDWRTMIVTAMIEMDSFVEAAWPSSEDSPPDPLEVARVLVVDAGDKYRLDYVATGTVVGVIDGIPQRVSHGYYVRDDMAKLRKLARAIYAWYAKERSALSIVLRNVADFLEVGDLVTTLSSGSNLQEVNAVVSSVRIDLVRGLTEIMTDFAELDPNQF
jgi:hypothetical protein